MRVTPTTLADVLLIEPRVFGDARGFFFESYNRRDFAQAGLDAEFVQDNHSRSARGVLRGLHYQVEHAQGKLVRVISGQVYDVAVDMAPRVGLAPNPATAFATRLTTTGRRRAAADCGAVTA